MSSGSRLPAAQYLRMSTEHQQYSLENQADAIRKYADAQGFEIIKTYTDGAKSGLVLKHRLGLAKLLSDVVGGPQPYTAILVYDVSAAAPALRSTPPCDSSQDRQKCAFTLLPARATGLNRYGAAILVGRELLVGSTLSVRQGHGGTETPPALSLR
jgi:hypothetical protein